MISQEFLQKRSTLGQPRFGDMSSYHPPRGEKTPTAATGSMPSHTTKVLCLWYLRPGSRESFISFPSLICWKAYRTMTQGCCKPHICWGWKDPDRLHLQAPKYEYGRDRAGCGGIFRHLHRRSTCAPNVSILDKPCSQCDLQSLGPDWLHSPLRPWQCHSMSTTPYKGTQS